ncbi:hypothetical protein FACS189468_4670 [Spirochaetia bacterium]|nr:hypothetical protein FACS189468_4670 [Spirochaetia bacterium]
MTERLVPTKNGFPTAYADKRTLHSRYDPRGEAEKYIGSLSLSPGIRFFILIEPCLGYIIPVLQKQFPHARLIVLHISDFFIAPEFPGEGISRPPAFQAPLVSEAPPPAVWSPESAQTLEEFLEQEIPDIEGRYLKLIEWRPAMISYGDAYLALLSRVAAFIKRVDANKRTLRGFGRRWLRNGLKNIQLFTNPVRIRAGSVPLVITASGPSLEDTLPLLREWKKKSPLFIMGVSSAVPALYEADLAPDLVVSTDGGGWALVHLREAYRKIRRNCPGSHGKQPFTLAAGLIAAIPSQYRDLPVLPISDGSLWQNILLTSLGISFIILPQRGTVSASAMDLAFTLTGGQVVITGLDLSHRDLRTHARPYGFDQLWEERAHRMNPVYSQVFIRENIPVNPGSHGIYAAWFAGQLDRYPKRLCTLGNNNPVFNTLSSGDTGAFTTNGALPLVTAAGPLPPHSPAEAGEILIHALDTPQYGGRLLEELGSLLGQDEGISGTGEEIPSNADMVKAELYRMVRSPEAFHG